MNKDMLCPYKPGDVIWYVYAQPGNEWLVALVVAVNGNEYTAYDTFLGRDISHKWQHNTGHSCGDSRLLQEYRLTEQEMRSIKSRANQAGLTLRFATDTNIT